MRTRTLASQWARESSEQADAQRTDDVKADEWGSQANAVALDSSSRLMHRKLMMQKLIS